MSTEIPYYLIFTYSTINCLLWGLTTKTLTPNPTSGPPIHCKWLSSMPVSSDINRLVIEVQPTEMCPPSMPSCWIASTTSDIVTLVGIWCEQWNNIFWWNFNRWFEHVLYPFNHSTLIHPHSLMAIILIAVWKIEELCSQSSHFEFPWKQPLETTLYHPCT